MSSISLEETEFCKDYVSKLKFIKILLKERLNNHIQSLKVEKDDLQSVHEKYKLQIFDYKENLRMLQLKVQTIQKDIASVHLAVTSGDKEIKEKKFDIKERNMRLKHKLNEKNKLVERLSATEQKIKEEEGNLKNNEHRNQLLIGKVTRSIDLIKNNLGLQIAKSSTGSLIVLFTKVCRSNPDKEYLIEFTIKNEEYQLLQSIPLIDTLPEIERRLNAANNFSAFLIYMRSLFTKIGS